MPDSVGGFGRAQAHVSFFFALFFCFSLFLLFLPAGDIEQDALSRRYRKKTKIEIETEIEIKTKKTKKKIIRYVPYPHKANRLAGERLRRSLEPLADAAGFDLVLSGHVHSFARSCNAAGLRCLPRASGGTVHYTLGCGGRKLSGVERVPDQPEWIAAAEDSWGFLRIDAEGSYRLTASFVRAGDGSVGDSVVLYGDERPPAHACRSSRGALGGFGRSGGNASAAGVGVEVA